MNYDDILDVIDTVTSNDVLLSDDTSLTDIPEEETVQIDLEQTDTLAIEDVSATDSLAVADTPTAECLFTDTNILAKLDIIIMLLIVIIALRMFSPLANNYKRGLNNKKDNK